MNFIIRLAIEVTIAVLETRRKWEQEIKIAGGNADSVRNAILQSLSPRDSTKKQTGENRKD